MDVQTRLQEFIQFKKLTNKDFEIKAGLANAAAKQIGENSRATTFDRIAIAFPELNINWLKNGEGEMLNQNFTPIHQIQVRQNNNRNSNLFGYVNIAIPEKGKQKILNSEGIVIESEDAISEQLLHYKSMIYAKDEQISRLIAIIGEKDKTIAKLLDKLCDI